MIANYIDGKHLTGSELKTYVDSVLKDSQVQQVIEKVQEIVPLSVNELEVSKAYIFDTALSLEGKREIFSSSILSLKNSENTISVLYNEFPEGTEDYILAKVYSDGKVHTITVNNGEVAENSTDDVVDFAGFDEGEVQSDENLPNNPSYKKGAYNVDLTAQGVFDFCLPGGYQHCGKGCGSFKGAVGGGGTPINATDRCCRTHDKCYSSTRKNRCCDKDLVNCVAEHKTAAANTIRYVFGGPALLCPLG